MTTQTVEEVDLDEWDSVSIEGDHTQVAEVAAALAETGKQVTVDTDGLNVTTKLDAGVDYEVTHYDNGKSVLQRSDSDLVAADVCDGDSLYVRN